MKFIKIITIDFEPEQYELAATRVDSALESVIKKDRSRYLRDIEQCLVTFKRMSNKRSSIDNGVYTDLSNMKISDKISGVVRYQYQNQKIRKFNNIGQVEIECHVNDNFDLDGPCIKYIFDNDINVKCTFKNGKLTENGININCTKSSSSIKITTPTFSLITADVEVNLDEGESGLFFKKIKNIYRFCYDVKKFKYINRIIYSEIEKTKIAPLAFYFSAHRNYKSPRIMVGRYDIHKFELQGLSEVQQEMNIKKHTIDVMTECDLDSDVDVEFEFKYINRIEKDKKIIII